jgi:hypothetical protein
VVNLLVFVLAFFLDFFELAFIVVPLLGPVADKLGIDLVWFGVLLAVNMQTSFMHPPFGFALFYLRSVAPHSEYIDRLTQKKIAPVTTDQIYWGAVPFVSSRCIMVGLSSPSRTTIEEIHTWNVASFCKTPGIAGILAAGAAPAVHAQAPAIRWRLASSFPKALDTIYGAAETFSKAVSEATGGKFTISVHAGGELMPPFGVVDGVQQGTVECAHTAPYYFFGKDDTFAIDCAIPFGLNSRQMTAWMYEGNGMKLLREFYAGYNIVNFPMGNTGAQMGGWYRKEIKTLADIKGLKMRIGGFGGKVLSAIGGVPQNIPGGEIYQALEKGHHRRHRVGWSL